MALTRTKWYLINIKARTNQTPLHYYNAFLKLQEEDPLVFVAEDKALSLMGIGDKNTFNPKLDTPDWMVLKIMSYVIVDPSGFYDRKERQKLNIEWNDNWVSNKKETEVLFCFANHTLAVRKTSDIPLNRLREYFSKALEAIEPETFDVDIVSDEDIINRIKSAYSIIKIEANISFGNGGHAKGFRGIFVDKVRETNPKSFNIKLEGTKTTPLGNEKDGLVDAIISCAERDGDVSAVIQEIQDAPYEKIETYKHPRVVDVEGDRDSFWVNVWNIIRNVFHE